MYSANSRGRLTGAVGCHLTVVGELIQREPSGSFLQGTCWRWRRDEESSVFSNSSDGVRVRIPPISQHACQRDKCRMPNCTPSSKATSALRPPVLARRQMRTRTPCQATLTPTVTLPILMPCMRVIQATNIQFCKGSLRAISKDSGPFSSICSWTTPLQRSTTDESETKGRLRDFLCTRDTPRSRANMLEGLNCGDIITQNMKTICVRAISRR